MASLRSLLTEVADSNGGELTPETVLESATPVESPLHSRFEWDNGVAGHAYRLSQAQQLIRSVKIRYEVEGEPRDVRAFTAVHRDDSPRARYVPTEVVAQDPMLRQLALQEAQRAWKVLWRKYRNLAGFIELVAEDVDLGALLPDIGEPGAGSSSAV
jgi:hypothetical protein